MIFFRSTPWNINYWQFVISIKFSLPWKSYGLKFENFSQTILIGQEQMRIKVSLSRLSGGKRKARALIQEHLGAEMVIAAVNHVNVSKNWPNTWIVETGGFLGHLELRTVNTVDQRWIGMRMVKKHGNRCW